MKRFSLTWVFLVPVLATVAMGFAAFSVYVDRVEYSSRIADVDAELVRAERTNFGDVTGDRVPPTPRQPGAQPGAGLTEQPEPPGTRGDVDTGELASDEDQPIALVINPEGEAVVLTTQSARLGASDLATLSTVDGFSTLNEAAFRAKVVQLPDGSALVTALSLEATQDAAASFRLALAGGGLVILFLVALVLWLLTRAIARPVIEIAESANRIAAGDLDEEISTTPTSREMADLSDDLEQMLDRLRGSLRESERHADDATVARDTMQRLLADMSHELRTPLTALKGYSDLYAQGMLESDEDVDRAMGRIGNESERLAALVNDMLQLARGNRAPTAMDEVNLHSTASAVAEDLAAIHPGIDVRVSPSGGSDVVIGSADQLHQAVLNLTSNACSFSKPGDSVELVIGRDANDVVVSVVDHGPGVDADIGDRVFLAFFRADEARHRNERGGAGLGLAIVSQIAVDHGGSVTHEPTPGGGATFALRLPASSSAVAVATD